MTAVAVSNTQQAIDSLFAPGAGLIIGGGYTFKGTLAGSMVQDWSKNGKPRGFRYKKSSDNLTNFVRLPDGLPFNADANYDLYEFIAENDIVDNVTKAVTLEKGSVRYKAVLTGTNFTAATFSRLTA